MTRLINALLVVVIIELAALACAFSPIRWGL